MPCWTGTGQMEHCYNPNLLFRSMGIPLRVQDITDTLIRLCMSLVRLIPRYLVLLLLQKAIEKQLHQNGLLSLARSLAL